MLRAKICNILLYRTTRSPICSFLSPTLTSVTSEEIPHYIIKPLRNWRWCPFFILKIRIYACCIVGVSLSNTSKDLNVFISAKKHFGWTSTFRHIPVLWKISELQDVAGRELEKRKIKKNKSAAALKWDALNTLKQVDVNEGFILRCKSSIHVPTKAWGGSVKRLTSRQQREPNDQWARTFSGLLNTLPWQPCSWPAPRHEFESVLYTVARLLRFWCFMEGDFMHYNLSIGEPARTIFNETSAEVMKCWSTYLTPLPVVSFFWLSDLVVRAAWWLSG